MSSRAIKGKCSTLDHKQTETHILGSIREVSLDVLVCQKRLQLGAVKDRSLRETDFWEICVFLCLFFLYICCEEHAEYAACG